MVSVRVNGRFGGGSTCDEVPGTFLIVVPVPVPAPPADEIASAHTCRRSHASWEFGCVAPLSVPNAHAWMTAPPVLRGVGGPCGITKTKSIGLAIERLNAPTIPTRISARPTRRRVTRADAG